MGGRLNIPDDCCRMRGVRCTNDYVTEIYWIRQGLTGFISPEIENLLDLEVL
jgi:hypothetical protein